MSLGAAYRRENEVFSMSTADTPSPLSPPSMTSTNGGSQTTIQDSSEFRLSKSHQPQHQFPHQKKKDDATTFARRASGIKQEYQERILSSSTTGHLRNSITGADIDSFTVNKLRFSDLGLIGRDKEQVILNDCLEQQQGQPKKKSFVLISGVSGTGKSSLAMSIKDTVVKRKNGAYFMGKFEMTLKDEKDHHDSEPYSGIIGACQRICTRILDEFTSSSPHLQTFQHALQQELGTEIAMLANIIPNLGEVIGGAHLCNNNNNNKHELTPANLNEAKDRFRHSFRSFLRIAANLIWRGPFVVLFDDIQWADSESLELIEDLMTDIENSKLILIGCYRLADEEVVDLAWRITEVKGVRKFISNLERQSKEYNFDLIQIPLDDLDVHAVNQIIMTLLCVDIESRTIGLAELCHRRTLGNCFHLLTFLLMLQKDHLLDYSLGLLEWQWDINEIEEETAVTCNVVDLMKQKMKLLSKDMVRLLQLASCLGSSFNMNSIACVWGTKLTIETASQIKSIQGSAELLDELLLQAIEERFLEMSEVGTYRWSHDKIQEAAVSIIPEIELSRFQYQVGMSLVHKLSEKDFASMIFVAVDLVNNIGLDDLQNEKERIKLQELNLQAAEKATELSAFGSAAKYARKGIHLLQADRWKNQFQVTLNLYSIGAETESFLGNSHEMQKYCDEVINNNGCSILCKLRVYRCLANNMANNGKALEAVNLCLGVLEGLGYKFPNNEVIRRFQVISKLLRMKVVTNIPTALVIQNMPIVTDHEKIETMKMMDSLRGYSYFRSNNIFKLATCEMVRFTMQHGINDCSPPAFCTLGVIIAGGFGEYVAAAKYAEIALYMLERTKTKETESKTLLIAWHFIFPWTKPLQMTIAPLYKSYKLGMQTGDTESAMYGIYVQIFHRFVSGRSLESLDADLRTYVLQMEDLKRQEASALCRLMWQTIQNMIGKSENTVLLVGDVLRPTSDNNFGEHSILEKYREYPVFATLFWFWKSILATYFGQHDLGAKLALEKGGYLKGIHTSIFILPNAFCRGISCYSKARAYRKPNPYASWKYRRKAIGVHRQIRHWVKQGNPNARHYEALLDAELAALNGQKQQACNHFVTAVSLAARSGFLQDAGLASQRYAEYLLLVTKKDTEERNEAIYRFNESIKYYTEWGAGGIIQVLREKWEGG